MDSLKLECALLSAGGQRRGKAAALALGGGGTVVGARGGGGDCVDHETAVFAGGPGCLGAGVEAFPFLCIIKEIVVVPVDKRRRGYAVWNGSPLIQGPGDSVRSTPPPGLD